MSVFHYEKFYEHNLDELIFQDYYGTLDADRQRLLNEELAANPEAMKRKEELHVHYSHPDTVAYMKSLNDRVDKSCGTVEKLMATTKRKNWRKRIRRDYYFYDDSRFYNLYVKHEKREIREMKAIQQGIKAAPTPLVLSDPYRDSLLLSSGPDI